MLGRIFIICAFVLGALYLIGKFPSAALVTMALGLVFMFLLFKDVD